MTLGYWLIVAAGLLAVVYGVVTAISVMSADAGTERMKEIAAAVQEGAGAYLNRQYRTIALAGVVILIILGFTLGRYTAIGRIERGKGVRVNDEQGMPIAVTDAGYRHF